MAITNHERVGKALELLKSGLGPFVERELNNAYQAKAQAQGQQCAGHAPLIVMTHVHTYSPS